MNRSRAVAVDARTLQGQPLGGVARSTLGHLRQLRSMVELTLLTDARRPPVDLALVGDLPQVPLKAPSHRGVAWLQVAAPRFLRDFDGYFHCPFYGLPFRQPVPMVTTIHDITFEQHPGWFTREQRTVFRMQARHAVRTARHVLTPSRFTKDEICEHYGIDPGRVSVARNLLDPGFAVPSVRRPTCLDPLGGAPYVIGLGGARRRGVDVLAAAWPGVQQAVPSARLVIVGAPGTPLPPDAIVVQDLTDEDWRSALAFAEVFCYPTHHEGFGYPALEALAVGTPVACARIGALPEVLGEAAHWLHDLVPSTIQRALIDLLSDPARRAELEAAGRAHAAVDHAPEVATALRRAFDLEG